ncbi:MAG TPA: FHA domain-containing protein, partial [Bacteroidota bacterium]
VFHRDIKASNVLFRDDQTPVLSDFGTGIGETERANAEKHNIGSPPYLGPEVWESKDYDATSDLYSMGVLLYYALTSRFPFVADSAEEYRRLHLSVPPVVPSNWRPGITKALDDIILSLLEKDPKNRIARADDLKENLDRVLVRSYAGHQQQNLKAILFSTGAGGNGTNITTFPYRIGKMEEWSGSERNDFIVGGEDPFVSRFHAVIDRIDDAFLFTDVSTNGSSVNGIHIHKQSVELLKTNEIVLGSKTALRLEVHPEEEPERNNNEDGTSILAESVEDLREKPGRKLVSTAAVLLALIVIVVLTHFSCM